MNLSSIQNYGVYSREIDWNMSTSRPNLQGFDMLSVDSQSSGIPREILKENCCVLARLNLAQIATVNGIDLNGPLCCQRLAPFMDILILNLRDIQNSSHYDGVLLTGLEVLRFSEDILILFAEEIAPYLKIFAFVEVEPAHGVLVTRIVDKLNGIVVKNVTLDSHGETIDFFKINSSFWELMKLANIQISMRTDFCCAILESIESMDLLSPAKISRLFKISQFYRAVPCLCSPDHDPLPLLRPSGILDVMAWPTFQRCRNLWRQHWENMSIHNASGETPILLSEVLAAPSSFEAIDIQSLNDTGDCPPEVPTFKLEIAELLPYQQSYCQHFLRSYPTVEDRAKLVLVQNSLMNQGLLKVFSDGELSMVFQDFASVSASRWEALGKQLKDEFMAFLYCGRLRIDFETASELEMMLTENGTMLPARVLKEIQESTPSELLSLLHWSDSQRGKKLRDLVGKEAKILLSTFTDMDQERLYGGLRILDPAQAEAAVAERLAEAIDRIRCCSNASKIEMPRSETLMLLLEKTRLQIRQMLLENDVCGLDKLLASLQECLSHTSISPQQDWLAFSIFAAFKNEAYDEVKTCVNDFNPLPSHEPDQEALMSELYVLGTRCEEFFDIGIHRLSHKLFEDRVKYLADNPPDLSLYQPRKLMFTYRPLIHCGRIRMNQSKNRGSWKSFGASIVFAIPALIDIFFLLGTGFGIFVNIRMSMVEQRALTFALLYSLLVCGCFNAAISTSGTYYLFLFQFPSMSSVLLRQFAGGLLCIWIVAFGVAILMGFSTVYGACVFMFYAIVYPIYFLSIGVFATIYSDSMPISSGRRMAWISVPLVIFYWLLAYLGNSKNYQLLIHSAFWGILAIVCIHSFTRYLSRLSNWLAEIKQTDCKAVLDWFLEKYNPSEIAQKKEGYIAEKARRQLEHDVKDLNRWRFFSLKSTSDHYVNSLAQSFSMTSFLLQWHSRHLDYDMPLPYGLEWNLNVKLAVQEMEKLNKASLLHRPQYFWNLSKFEMSYGMLFFVILLLDRWIILLSGGDVLGLLTIQVGVGLGLQAKSRTVRKSIYCKYLLVLITSMALGHALVTLLLWNLATNWTPVLVYMGLSSGYSSMIWMTYSKSFCLPNSRSVATCLMLAAVIGLSSGLAFHFLLPQYFPEQISLIVSQWTAAIMVFRVAWWNEESEMKAHSSDRRIIQSPENTQLATGQHLISHEHVPLTDFELDILIHRRLDTISIPLDADGILGKAVLHILSDHALPKSHSTFPEAHSALGYLIENWNNPKRLQIRLLNQHEFTSLFDRHLLGLSRQKDVLLTLYVAVPLMSHNSSDTILTHSTTVQAMCETIIHEAARALIPSYRHVDAVILETIAADFTTQALQLERQIPDRIVKEMEMSSDRSLRNLVSRTRNFVVKGLCFGADIDQIWGRMSRSLRSLIIRRVEGKAPLLSTGLQNELCSVLGGEYSLLERNSCFLVHLAIRVGLLAKKFMERPSHSQKILNLDAHAFTDHHYRDDDSEWPAISTLPTFSHVMNRAGEIWMEIVMGDTLLPRNLCSDTGDGEGTLQQLRHPDRTIRRVITDTYIQIHSPLSPETAILQSKSQTSLIFNHYHGILIKPPLSKKQIIATSEYNLEFLLLQRATVKNGRTIQLARYSYADGDSSGVPSSKDIFRASGEAFATCELKDYYDIERGRVSHGRSIQDRVVFNLRFLYYSPESFEVLEVRFSIPQFSLLVKLEFYVSSALGDKIPTSTIQRAIIEYLPPSSSVSSNPDKTTATSRSVLVGKGNPEPILVQFPDILSRMEQLGFLNYPTEILHFRQEHPFFFHRVQLLQQKKLSKDGFWSKLLPLFKSSCNNPEEIMRLDVGKARTALWKKWIESSEVHGVWARMIDEILLRNEPLLKVYWSKRDKGNFAAARSYLLARQTDLMASALYLSDSKVRSQCHMAIRFEDLIEMGVGGDSGWRSGKEVIKVEIPDKAKSLENSLSSPVSVLSLATGTWPSSSGGVSNCIRDVVNSLKSVEWTVLAENAHELELILPQFQIDKNVSRLLLLPLWGFDGLQPCHDFDGSLTDAILATKRLNTTSDAISRFLPILERIISCCEGVSMNLPSSTTTIPMLTSSHLISARQAFVSFYEFFVEEGKAGCDYITTWSDPRIRETWKQAWMRTISKLGLDIEKPTIGDLWEALNYFKRTLFCLTVRIPDPMPDVIQTTHHAIGSVYGVVCKAKTGKPMLVWDHGILWREYLGHWSSCESTSPPFCHSLLLTLARLVASLTLHDADWILPCTKFSNPIWEAHRMMLTSSRPSFVLHDSAGDRANGSQVLMPGIGYGDLRRTEAYRKIDPVVNGIVGGVDDFLPDHREEAFPDGGGFLVVMLSHIVTFKDIKNAIFAADLIVNKFGIKGYHLDIYGSTDKVPWYTYECSVLIHMTGLQDHVKIRGFGDSKYVLNRAWLVLNSSIAEGLPLALGEAGLCGQPIVCTEAGGSREVIQIRQPVLKGSSSSRENLSDQASWEAGVDSEEERAVEKEEVELRYLQLGRSVSPSNPYELAVAQLEVLGMFDGLEEMVDDLAGTLLIGSKTQEPLSKDVSKLVDSGAELLESTFMNVDENVGQAEGRHRDDAGEKLYPRIRDWIAAERFHEIEQRVYKQKEARRRLGLCLRQHVISKFSGERYLREHEQALHIAFGLSKWTS
ncbi:hypothetical protein HDU97_009504 [Phlyctochytrium planicorne]|nr:hypothetical protein HDU97_009504 [Phlyctochytrium planicorne]